MNNWLVIGASSFTGSHFCRYLREIGEEVIEASLRDAAFPLADRVVNFAALNVVVPSWQHPREYFEVNVQRQIPLWQDLARRGVPYLHVSSPEAYGSTSGWVSEEHPYRPSTPYAVSRAAAEMMLTCYHRQYGMPVVFTRACNVYGPGQQFYRLIPKLIVAIKKGEKFLLEGGGRSARSFVHVRDVCEATYLIATQGTPGEAYHITSADYQPIAGLVRLVCGLMGKNWAQVVEDAPERPGKDSDYQLRGDKLRGLGWERKIGLVEGVQSVIDWVNRNWDTLKDVPTKYEFKP